MTVPLHTVHLLCNILILCKDEPQTNKMLAVRMKMHLNTITRWSSVMYDRGLLTRGRVPKFRTFLYRVAPEWQGS